MTSRLLVIDAEENLAAHLAQAIAEHRAFAAVNGFAVPRELLALESMARNQVRSGQPGSTLDSSGANGESEAMAPRLLTYAEAGRLMAVSDSTVKRLVVAGDLAPVHIGGAARLRISDIDAYIEGLAAGSRERVTA